MTARKQNTPSKQSYWRGKGSNPRQICPKCGRFMLKLKKEITIEPKKRTLIFPVTICKCGYLEVNEEELEKIPD
jgi:C4-type Zn-finger protein